MSDFEKIIGLFQNECERLSRRLHEASCSAEWLYVSGKRDELLKMLSNIEKIHANEQQR